MYGVSYFSSKGPTGDGRYKPDLLAPGEKIISCAAPNEQAGQGRSGQQRVLLLREQRHEHGRAARQRRHRGISLHPQRVHRRSREGQKNLHLHGDRPRPRPLFPGRRARGPYARHSVRLISLNSNPGTHDRNQRHPLRAGEVRQGRQAAKHSDVPAGTTDFIVVSHGWNNTELTREELYRKLFGNFADQITGTILLQGSQGCDRRRHLASKKIRRPDDAAWRERRARHGRVPNRWELRIRQPQKRRCTRRSTARLRPFDDPGDDQRVAKLHSLVPTLEKSKADKPPSSKTLRELLDPNGQSAEQQHEEDGSDVLFGGQPRLVFENAANPAPASASSSAAVPRQPVSAGSGQALRFLRRLRLKAPPMR